MVSGSDTPEWVLIRISDGSILESGETIRMPGIKDYTWDAAVFVPTAGMGARG